MVTELPDCVYTIYYPFEEYVLLLVIETFFCVYGFYHLRKPEHVHPSLRIACLFYHAVTWSALLIQCSSVGISARHRDLACPIFLFFENLLLTLAYGAGIFFWLKRLDIVFGMSLLKIKRTCLWGLYLTTILTTLTLIVLGGWTSSAFACLAMVDNHVFSHLHICAGFLEELIILRTCLVSILNIVVGYMYVTRLFQTARAVHRNEELESTYLGDNPSNHKLSNATMNMLDHVKKSGLIALVSIIFAIVPSVSACISIRPWSGTGFFYSIAFMYVDCVLEGIWILCSFAFADKMFRCCFGCCSPPMETLLDKAIRTNISLSVKSSLQV